MNHWTDPVFLFPPHGRNPNKSEGLLRAPTSHTELSRWLTNLRTHTIEIIIIKHKYRSVLYKVWRLNRAVLEQGSGGMKGFLSHRRVITLGSVGVPVVVLPLAFILFPRASVWQTSKSGWNNEQKHTHTQPLHLVLMMLFSQGGNESVSGSVTAVETGLTGSSVFCCSSVYWSMRGGVLTSGHLVWTSFAYAAAWHSFHFATAEHQDAHHEENSSNDQTYSTQRGVIVIKCLIPSLIPSHCCAGG